MGFTSDSISGTSISAETLYITSVGSGTSITNLGVDLNGNVVSGTTASPYKVYTALLTQTGTSDPDVVILENTIGNIVWTRTTDGVYAGTLSGAFTSNKTALLIQDKYTFSSIAISRQDVWIDRQNNNEIAIYTLDQTNLIDNVLNNTTIEIRVYN